MRTKSHITSLILSIAAVVFTVSSTNALAAGFGQGAATNGSSQSKAVNELLSNNTARSVNTAKSAPRTAVAQRPNVPTASHSSGDLSLGGTNDGKTAFANMTRNIMPLTTEQIKSLRSLFDKTKRAAASYPGTPPRPTSSSIMVNLSPGSAPPVIRLQSGFISAIQFLDSTGQPWPITAYDLGDPSNFNISWSQQANPSTLLIQAMSSYRSGNLAVMLKGKSTPIMITLLPGQAAVDYRDELRIPGLGPNATPDQVGLPDTSSPQMLTVLDGVPPMGAKTLQVSDPQSQAWLYGGKLYLRTHFTLLSPSWLASMSSPDGTHAYELVATPVVLVSNRGATQQLLIKGL